MSTDATFLEFVIGQLIGPPVHRKGNGSSSWCCPFHADNTPSFFTLPRKQNTKERFKCHGCGAGGDVWDFLIHKYPSEKFPQRKIRVANLMQEFGRIQKSSSVPSQRIRGGEGSQVPFSSVLAAIIELAAQDDWQFSLALDREVLAKR